MNKQRCNKVYFCSLNSSSDEEIERCRCIRTIGKNGKHNDNFIKEGIYKRECLTKERLTFDYNCWCDFDKVKEEFVCYYPEGKKKWLVSQK